MNDHFVGNLSLDHSLWEYVGMELTKVLITNTLFCNLPIEPKMFIFGEETLVPSDLIHPLSIDPIHTPT